MKVAELFETVSDTPASQEDLDWSVAKIKEVKAELTELAKKDKYDIKNATSVKARSEVKRWQSIFEEAQWRMDFAIEMHEKIIPAFNKLKAAANKAYKNKDVEAAKKVQQDLKAFVIEHDLIKQSRRVMHRDRMKLKIERGYPRKIYDAIEWILHVRDEMPKLILRAGRTDAENKKADKASSAMKARWGSY